MQEGHDRGPKARRVEVPGLSPIRAFLVVCTLATVLGGAFFATRDASPSEPPAQQSPRSPDYSLTDAEAIAEFERLNTQLLTAYRQRDISSIKLFAESESPLARTVERELHTLVRDGVRDVTRIRSISQEVVSNTASVVEVEQVLIEQPKFIDARTGRDVTVRSTRQRQTVLWTMKLRDGRWFLSSATITAAEPART